MERRKLVALGIGAAVLAAAVAVLRVGTGPAETITTSDGTQLRAAHDPQRITPPNRPVAEPRPPGELRLDHRRDGALVTWPASPTGFEVRWGRAGGSLDQVSYVLQAATTLHDLDPGRYRVEVRSVDGIGQRSRPASAEFDVSGEPPDWQRGLGFAADFTEEPALDPVRWLVRDSEQGCFSRADSTRRVLLVNTGCLTFRQPRLRPASPLVLGEPDAAGVRGRILVITDAAKANEPDVGLTIMAAPAPALGLDRPIYGMDLPATGGSVRYLEQLPPAAIALRVGAGSASIELGSGIAAPAGPVEYRPPAEASTGPGVLHRWELVFTSGGVEVRQDGELVMAAQLAIPWRQAPVHIMPGLPITPGQFGSVAVSPTEIAMVGLTGSAPDPLPSRIAELYPTGSFTAPSPTVYAQAAGAVSGRLSLASYQIEPTAGPPDSIAIEAKASPASPGILVAMHPVDGAGSTSFATDLPAELLTDQLQFTLRREDAEVFIDLVLELSYPAGSAALTWQPRVMRPPVPELPTPTLYIHSPDTNRVLLSGERALPAKHRVELRMDDATGYDQLVPWLAVLIELDGRPILTFPTARAGPAITDQYEFTLDLSGLSASTHSLTVRLVPDRVDVAPATVEHSIKLG